MRRAIELVLLILLTAVVVHFVDRGPSVVRGHTKVLRQEQVPECYIDKSGVEARQYREEVACMYADGRSFRVNCWSSGGFPVASGSNDSESNVLVTMDADCTVTVYVKHIREEYSLSRDPKVIVER